MGDISISRLPQQGYHRHKSFIRGPTRGSPLNTQGGSPVRELRPPGSVRGVPSNAYPYRDVRRETGKE